MYRKFSAGVEYDKFVAFHKNPVKTENPKKEATEEASSKMQTTQLSSEEKIAKNSGDSSEWLDGFQDENKPR
jgi:hypothetical protein